MAAKRYRILGVPVDALTIEEATHKIVAEAADRTSPARMVTKPYVEFLDRAEREPAVAALFDQAWLNLPDGVALQWASQYLYGGRRTLAQVVSLGAQIVLRPTAVQGIIPEKFGGVNATWPLLRAAEKANLTVFIVGSPKNGITPTLDRITKELPAIRVAGTFAGELSGLRGEPLQEALRDPSQQPEAELLAALKKAKPDLILVAMGFPLQEFLMSRLLLELRHGIMVGEGGTFDYESFGGTISRAPAWMQRTGLEWLYRLLRQPRRLKRQLAIPRFIVKVYRDGKQA